MLCCIVLCAVLYYEMFGVIQALNTTDGDFICYISSKYSYVDHLSKKKKKLFFYQLKYAGRFDRALTF